MSLHDLNFIAPYICLSLGGLMVLMLGIMPWATRYHLPFWCTIAVLLLTAWSAFNLVDRSQVIENLLVINSLSQICIVIFSLLTVAILLVSQAYQPLRGHHDEGYLSLLLFALTGACLIPASVNLVIFFIGIELIAVTGFCLIAWNPSRPGAIEASIKYLVTAGVSASFMVLGIALIYAGSGTLVIGQVVESLITPKAQGFLVLTGTALLIAAIAFELAIAPFHFWLADVYQGGPTPVVMFIAIINKLVLLVFLLILSQEFDIIWLNLQSMVLILAILSMVMGNILALRQTNLKRILAYSSVAQFGYLLIPLGLLSLNQSSDILKGSILLYYGIGYALATLAILATIALLEEEHEPSDLEFFRGLGRKHPLLGGVISLSIFSLAGIPPLAGFSAKLMVFYSVLTDGNVFLAVIFALASALSFYYYFRIILTLYSKQEQNPKKNYMGWPDLNTAVDSSKAATLVPLAAVTLLLLLSFFVHPVVNAIGLLV